MSNLKSFLGIAAMMTAVAYGEKSLSSQKSKTEGEKKDKQKKTKNYKAKGLTEFFYGENSIWALNQKSADKKALKRNYGKE